MISSFSSPTGTEAEIKLFVPGGSAKTTVLLASLWSVVILMSLTLDTGLRLVESDELTGDAGTERGNREDYFLHR
jgi:hypothetical protein